MIDDKSDLAAINEEGTAPDQATVQISAIQDATTPGTDDNPWMKSSTQLIVLALVLAISAYFIIQLMIRCASSVSSGSDETKKENPTAYRERIENPPLGTTVVPGLLPDGAARRILSAPDQEM